MGDVQQSHGDLEVPGVSRIQTGAGASPRVDGCDGAVNQDPEQALTAERRLSATLERAARASAAIATVMMDAQLDERAVLSEIVEHARALVGAQLGALGIGSDPARPFEPWVVRGVDRELVAHLGAAPRPVGVLGAVARGGEILRLRDAREHGTYIGVPSRHPPVTSFLGLPLRARGEAVGTLYLANKADGGEFTLNDERALMLLAGQIGAVLWNRKLRSAVARERERLEVLASSSATVGESLDFEGTLQRVTDAAVPKLADWSIVWSVDEDGSKIHPRAYAHVPEIDADLLRAFIALGPLRADWGGIPLVVSERRPFNVQIGDPRLDGPGVAPWSAILRELRLASLLSVPIIGHARILGVLGLASRTADRYTPEDVIVAEELGRRAGLALANARLYREAREAIRTRDDVLAIVSHDLRNPLNGIVLQAGVLARSVKGQPELDAILRAAWRMDAMIADLLDAASLDAGHLSLAPARNDVGKVARAAMEAAEPLAQARSIGLSGTIGDLLPPVACDRDRTLQVLSNLLGNAIKFAPHGGHVRFDVQLCEDRVRFAISDDGPGIGQEELPHVFERYWKGRLSGVRGTGLGLHIAKGIVEAQGGTIGVESREGNGSTFFFTLPGTAQDSAGA